MPSLQMRSATTLAFWPLRDSHHDIFDINKRVHKIKYTHELLASTTLRILNDKDSSKYGTFRLVIARCVKRLRYKVIFLLVLC